jgi:hypothetical protein
MEENQRDCWGHAIYSNRPTEGELTCFQTWRSRGNILWLFPLETFDFILENNCSEAENSQILGFAFH